MSVLPIGYCTNVHAGASLTQTRANLLHHAVAVRQRVHAGAPMGVGLWLSANSAREILLGNRLQEWSDWLATEGLVPYTFNGFPHGDFHQPVVKHRVYLPTWYDQERYRYTLDLIRIQDALLPKGMSGTISTLPIGWGISLPGKDHLHQSGQFLIQIGQHLKQLEDSTGRHIMVCLEPEPGCILERSQDVVHFMETYLFAGNEESTLRRYLGVCHDVCHASVMFEDQADALRSYFHAGINVGKIQISSAIGIDFNRLPPNQRELARAQLARFNETRYLHQTCIQKTHKTPIDFFEDVSIPLESQESLGEWRTHFHVPIYLSHIGHLKTSQEAILQCRSMVKTLGIQPDFEVETYAWGVLPPEHQEPSLADGIARELEWWKELNIQEENASDR